MAKGQTPWPLKLVAEHAEYAVTSAALARLRGVVHATAHVVHEFWLSGHLRAVLPLPGISSSLCANGHLLLVSLVALLLLGLCVGLLIACVLPGSDAHLG